MTTINDIADLIRILRTDPHWAEAVRSVLLSQELQKLPEEFAALTKAFREQTETVNRRLELLEAGQRRLEAGQERLEKGQAQLQTSVDDLETTVSGLESSVNAMRDELGTLSDYFYQGRAGRIANRVARRRFQLRQTSWAHLDDLDGRSSLSRLLDAAAEDPARDFTEDEASLVERTDAVIAGKAPDGTDVYLLAEFSITIDKDDVDRAKERAELLHRATGAKTHALVIGESINDEAAAHAEEREVAFAEFIRKGRKDRNSQPSQET